MKKFKKLIPALCMLLVSAVLMGTSTFAWFSMNKTATVDGLSVKANAESIYLLISNTQASTTAEAIQGENGGKGFTTVSETVADAQLKPSALATKATKDGVKETTITDYSDVNSWYTADAIDASASDVKQDSEKKLTTFDGYVFTYTYRLTLAKGSTATTNLKVGTCTFKAEGGKTIDAARVLVVCGENTEEFKPGTTAGTVTLAENISDSTVVEVKVYVYIDGNDTSIFTNNVENLDQANITLTFVVD